MKYINSDTGTEISLKQLKKGHREFYDRALELYRHNESWLRFEEYAFGSLSPLYKDRNSHLEVVKDPLYLALEDMWLQLGVQQGMIKRQGKRHEQRRLQGGRGQAEEATDREESDHLAVTR